MDFGWRQLCVGGQQSACMRYLAIFLVVAVLAGCVAPEPSTTSPGTTNNSPTEWGWNLQAVTGSANFSQAWDESVAAAAVEAMGFPVLWATQDGLSTKTVNATQLTVQMRPNATWSLDVHFTGAEVKFSGSQEEVSEQAALIWRNLEPRFLEIVGEFEQKTSLTHETYSWQPVLLRA